MSVLPSSTRSAIVGRDRDIEDLSRRIDGGARLITLVGPGGVGKSRLAAEVVKRLGARFEGGVVIADLTRIHDAVELPRLVLEAMGEPHVGERPVAAALTRRAPTLLWLDNLEHIVDAGARALTGWLAAGDHCFLVTSQVAARIEGEHVHAVEPLALEDAQRLLRARVREAAPEVPLDEPAVRELAERLDRLPLAIELAASRARLLAPAELLARLDDRFALLRSRQRDRGARHATLEATLEWAYELLSDDEREALGACSVFVGDFDLASAEAVLGPSGEPPLDRFEALIDRSLIARDAPPPRARFRLLESVRDFARRRADLGPARARFRAHYLDRHAPHREVPLDQVSADSAHLRAILAEGAPLERAAAALALSPLYESSATREEHLELLERAVKDSAESAPLEARAHVALARACAVADPVRARAALERADGLDDDGVAFERRLAHAFVLRQGGDLDGAEAELREAARAARGLAAARAARDLAVVHMLAGRGAQARAQYEAARRTFLAGGDTRAAADVSAHLGVLALEDDDALARERLEFALAEHRAAGDRRREGTVLCNLGVLEHQSGALDAAEGRWSEALALNRAVGNPRFEAFALAGLAAVLHERGELAEAKGLVERSCELFETLHDPRWEGWARSRRGAVRRALGDLDGARADFEAARALLVAAGATAWLPAVDVLEGRAVAPDEPGSAVRIARRLAGALASPREVSGGAEIALASDGAWFERDGQRVSLARRHAMRRLLGALVVHLRDAPGRAMSTDGLVAAGWPGERMRPDSGAARVYSAVRALRRMGLEGVLISAHGGYLLSATASVAVA